MSNIVIDIDNVSFNYGMIPVLKDISLKIHEDEFIGIIGPNGSGKSTLLKLILGLLKPDKGVIKKYNQKCQHKRHHIGYVPQHVNFARDFPVTVEEVVMMGHITTSSLFFKFNKDEVSSAMRAMQTLEIEDIAKRQIGSLSGGQLQRVLIARALVCQPNILILDEPTSNVDVRVEEDIFALLKNFSEHMTIIVVSHDIAFISGYVDRVACLNLTMVCHDTESISGKMIEELYGTPVKMIHHHH
ncbi:MAG: ABC transporter ATP-binding protein [Proteobacteria bacterium]|nr:ABC transporter ATP-binding protein [Pseudomonadota bacterium]NOG61070.1 ABC transporter ATP-binding protein [Pseudomonadota bacterium]